MQEILASYTLENEKLQVEVMNLGASLVRFIDKKTNTDIVLGFDDLEDYKNHSEVYMGATVGRCANRIENGRFKINDVEYLLSINQPPHSLHGGFSSFSNTIFETRQTENAIFFTYESKDMEEGYPGNLKLEIEYRLVSNHLFYFIRGESDQDTLFNITQHAYFNLDGKGNILNHKMRIYTDKVAMIDQNGLTKDMWIHVENTPFDYRDLTVIQKQLKKSHWNIQEGYDHHFIFENMDYKCMAELKNENMLLRIESDLPGMHVYSGNYLNVMGKNGEIYQSKSGICFECQFYPNAIHYDKYLKPILKAKKKAEYTICFSVEEEYEHPANKCDS